MFCIIGCMSDPNCTLTRFPHSCRRSPLLVSLHLLLAAACRPLGLELQPGHGMPIIQQLFSAFLCHMCLLTYIFTALWMIFSTPIIPLLLLSLKSMSLNLVTSFWMQSVLSHAWVIHPWTHMMTRCLIFNSPMVYGLGVISTPHETLPNGSTGFSVALTEYVCDANQQSNVQYIVFALYSHVTKSSHSCIIRQFLSGGTPLYPL